MLDKDKSIISQVAAKIASDLTINNISVDDFAEKFVGVQSVLLDAIYGYNGDGTPVADGVRIAEQAFNATAQFTVNIRGKQHGDLPGWLLDACKRDGITEVYDNRDGLAENPRRPWFKAVNDKEKAYWPPKGK